MHLFKNFFHSSTHSVLAHSQVFASCFTSKKGTKQPFFGLFCCCDIISVKVPWMSLAACRNLQKQILKWMDPLQPCNQSCSPVSITGRFTVLSVMKGLWARMVQPSSFHDEMHSMSKRMYLSRFRNSYTSKSLQVSVPVWQEWCDTLQWCFKTIQGN